MLPPREWSVPSLAALAAALLAPPLLFGLSALTVMDAAAVGVLAAVLLGRATGLTWSDAWRMGMSTLKMEAECLGCYDDITVPRDKMNCF